ncbi:MAG: alcohol dehydrogenase, partial [Desulfamplus sp.]|nr:alcohol dehydrogenase [Desulfamplus sp.]
LTKIDFEKLLEFHVDHQAHGTTCVRQYDYQIPYGVVRFDGVDLLDMEEKPIKQFFVNAGIYVLSPESLDHIPGDQFFDMPSLFKILKQRDGRAAVFPIHEYWMDIGQIKDFERANGEYQTYFCAPDKNDING